MQTTNTINREPLSFSTSSFKSLPRWLPNGMQAVCCPVHRAFSEAARQPRPSLGSLCRVHRPNEALHYFCESSVMAASTFIGAWCVCVNVSHGAHSKHLRGHRIGRALRSCTNMQHFNVGEKSYCRFACFCLRLTSWPSVLVLPLLLL